MNKKKEKVPMRLSLGNVTLTEEMIDWVPSPTGPRTTEPRVSLSFGIITACDKDWFRAAFIHEPSSPNPGLNILNESRTIGIASVARMLILMEEWRKRNGLKPSMASETDESIQEIE